MNLNDFVKMYLGYRKVYENLILNSKTIYVFKNTYVNSIVNDCTIVIHPIYSHISFDSNCRITNNFINSYTEEFSSFVIGIACSNIGEPYDPA